jgi:hypothetical protein
MIDYSSDNIFTKADILNAFVEMGEKVEFFYRFISDSDFFSTEFGGWSAAQNLQHLVTVNRLVYYLLKIPKWTFCLIPNQKTAKTFAEWKSYYLNRENPIYAGPLQPGRIFLPKDPSFFREKLINEWRNSISQIQESLMDFSEKDLLECNTIHTDMEIGIITMREMVFIILIHFIHHSRKVQKKLELKGRKIAI